MDNFREQPVARGKQGARNASAASARAWRTWAWVTTDHQVKCHDRSALSTAQLHWLARLTALNRGHCLGAKGETTVKLQLYALTKSNISDTKKFDIFANKSQSLAGQGNYGIAGNGIQRSAIIFIWYTVKVLFMSFKKNKNKNQILQNYIKKNQIKKEKYMMRMGNAKMYLGGRCPPE